MPLPAVGRHVELDLAIRTGWRQLETDALALMQACDELMQMDYWRAWSHDARSYWEDRVGVSYETVQRRLRLYRALQAAPEPARPQLAAALLEVGVAKADALVRLPVEQLPAALEDARELSLAAIRERVNEALGLPAPTERPPGPGERWWAYTLRLFASDPEAQAEIERVFAAGRRLAETDSPLAVFVCMVREVASEWLRPRS